MYPYNCEMDRISITHFDVTSVYVLAGVAVCIILFLVVTL